MTALEMFNLNTIRDDLRSIKINGIKADLNEIAKKNGLPEDSQFIYDKKLYDLLSEIDNKIERQVSVLNAIISSAKPS